MSEKRFYRFVHNEARIRAARDCMEAPDGWCCTISEPSRTLEQNSYQWPYLEGFAKQLKWPVNGEMVRLSSDEWKDVLTSAFENEVNPRLAMGFDGGVVMLGRRTGNFGKKKFAEWMEFLFAAAALKGVTPIFKNGENKRWPSMTAEQVEQMAETFVGE